ncbi:MAG: hypothetical protein PUA56_06055 [Bacillales bacterium]|nr:hypothetical protein [Bacillales bacterium]
MLTLLAKDFKLMFGSQKGKKDRILSGLLNILFIGIFIAIETFIYNMILSKLKPYTDAPLAFTTIFLFIITMFMIISGVINAKKLFFNDLDIENLTVLPVSNTSIISSKLIFLFASQFITCLMFTLPVFISYGLMIGKQMVFYYLALFYPIFTFIFEGGIALLLVYPYKLISDFFKKHLSFQFIVSIVLIFGLCIAYYYVLNIFVSLVASNNIESLLTSESLKAMVDAKKYFIPTRFVVDFFLLNNFRYMLPYLAISSGVLLLGGTVSIYSYNHLRILNNNLSKTKNRIVRIVSPTKALIKKEFILLFKKNDNIFSYTGLLVAQPFLVYLVVHSLNQIFTSGTLAYYVSQVNFIPLLDVLLVMMFTLIINQDANKYILKEAKNVRIMKTIPISIYRQLFIKVAIPFLLSSTSLTITMSVLFITREVVSFVTFIFGIFMSILLLIVLDVISLYEELKVSKVKQKSTLVSNIYSYLLPICYFMMTIILSYFGLPLIVVLSLGIFVIILLGFPFFIRLKSRVGRLFQEFEVQ